MVGSPVAALAGPVQLRWRSNDEWSAYVQDTQEDLFHPDRPMRPTQQQASWSRVMPEGGSVLVCAAASLRPRPSLVPTRGCAPSVWCMYTQVHRRQCRVNDFPDETTSEEVMSSRHEHPTASLPRHGMSTDCAIGKRSASRLSPQKAAISHLISQPSPRRRRALAVPPLPSLLLLLVLVWAAQRVARREEFLIQQRPPARLEEGESRRAV